MTVNVSDAPLSRLLRRFSTTNDASCSIPEGIGPAKATATKSLFVLAEGCGSSVRTAHQPVSSLSFNKISRSSGNCPNSSGIRPVRADACQINKVRWCTNEGRQQHGPYSRLLPKLNVVRLTMRPISSGMRPTNTVRLDRVQRYSDHTTTGAKHLVSCAPTSLLSLKLAKAHAVKSPISVGIWPSYAAKSASSDSRLRFLRSTSPWFEWPLQICRHQVKPTVEFIALQSETA